MFLLLPIAVQLFLKCCLRNLYMFFVNHLLAPTCYFLFLKLSIDIVLYSFDSAIKID